MNLMGVEGKKSSYFAGLLDPTAISQGEPLSLSHNGLSIW